MRISAVGEGKGGAVRRGDRQSTEADTQHGIGAAT
jgi:hypothetical protein